MLRERERIERNNLIKIKIKRNQGKTKTACFIRPFHKEYRKHKYQAKVQWAD